MKYTFSIISILVVFVSLAASQTIVPGGTINGSTWTRENEPYIITGNMTIVNLTIEPGVRVQFRNNFNFDVNGILQAQGFYSDSIYFHSEPGNSAGWKGFKFKSGTTNTSLRYCRIENANTQGIRIEGGAAPVITNCLISKNNGNGIYIKDSGIELKHCIVKDNTMNGLFLDAGQITAINIIIAGNQLAGILTSDKADMINLTNTVIADNQTSGIDCRKGGLTITNCIVYQNKTGLMINDQDIDITFSDVQGSGTYPGTGNINALPAFESGLLYKLSDQSPCIDGGTPGSAFEDKYFPPSKGTTNNDMGAYGGPLAFAWYPPLLITPQLVQYGRTTQDSVKTVILQIDNYRDSGITVSEIEFEGLNSEVFSAAEDYFYLPLLQDKTLQVSFKPNNVDLFSADIIFQTVGHGNVLIPLNGEGVLPRIDVLQSTLDFGLVLPGDSLTLNLPIRNLGGDTLRVNLSLLSDSTFKTDKVNLKINPDAALDTVQVTFKPRQPESFQTYLIISSNDRANPNVAVLLTGEGLGPIISTSTQSLDFGTMPVNADSTIDLLITNNGNALLNIDSLRLSSTATAFEIIDDRTLSVEAGGNALISVRFHPLNWGLHRGDLQIYSNDLAQPLMLIALTGTGLAPGLAVSDTVLDFGTVYLTTDSTLILTVFNQGNLPLMMDSIFIENNDGPFQITETTSDRIEPDQSLDIRLTFSPVDSGHVSDLLILKSNDPLKDQDTISLKGLGIRPVLDPADLVLDFSTVHLPADTTLYLNVKNSGNYALVIKNFSVSSQRGGFSRAESLVFPDTLARQEDRDYPITFKPLVWGADTGHIIIETNDPLQAQTSIRLQGMGIAPQIEVIPTLIEFGTVSFGSDSTIDFIIQNLGNGTLVIDSLELLPKLSGFEISDTNSVRIDSGKTATFSVSFNPLQLDSATAQIYIYSNDPINPKKSLMLDGLVFDNQFCSIAFDSLNSTHPLINKKPATLRFIITATSTSVDSAFISVRAGGKSDFQDLSLSKQGTTNIWSVSLDSTLVSSRGLEYFIRAFHGWTSTLFPDESNGQPASIRVQIPQTDFPKQTKKEIYQMISVPFETSNQYLEDLFSDNLGSYDKKQYRVFDCVNGLDYTEIDHMDIPLPPGKALWLITRVPTKLDINNGRTVPTDQKFTLELKKGWNMIATPYDFAVDWTEISDILKLRYFLDGEWTYAQVLEPYEGYALYTASDTSLVIPAKESNLTKVLDKINPFPTDTDWEFQLQAQSGVWKDRFNYVGVHPLATSAIDLYDDPEPPPIGDFISLGLAIGTDCRRFTTDYREQGKDGYTFVIEMSSNINDEKIIRLTPHNLPDQYDWTIIYEESQANLGKEEIKTGLNAATYLLIVGTKDFLSKATAGFTDLPLVYHLQQNYPNPFNPNTTIKFQLAETQKVTLNIFNILGQRVKTLLEQAEKQAGYHQVEWDGSNHSGQKVSSGVYFLRFETEQFERTIKMVLQR